MVNVNQRTAIKQFIAGWTNRGDEKSDTQSFWLALLRNVLGIERPESVIQFEKRVKLKNVGFIDASIPSTHVLIEQKSADVDLTRTIRQSDGSMLTPYEQALRYNNRLPYSQRNKWIVVCNFREFHIHDMDTPDAEPTIVTLENLETQASALVCLVDETQTEAYREMQLSIDAGALVGRLYDALRSQYLNPDSPETLRNLNILCVRLVFCFYAEDAGILGKRNCVYSYLNKRRNADIRHALMDLFSVLNTRPNERDPYLDEDLLAFPYVDGGLFEEQGVEIPRFNSVLTALLTNDCCRDFDWSGISPTIFGAVFESTLNPETRRGGGMHYTSIENIHRVIAPLFLDELRSELEEIFALTAYRTRERKLREFHKKLGSLTFFDPACGSGNFLTETYISLRRLENDVLRAMAKGQMFLSENFSPIQVKIEQFYGIEINDFAVSVARTALWIAESQMLQETEDIVQRELEYLPLRSYANIFEGNALQMNWEQVAPKERLTYIMGNPPFVGARIMNKTQKDELFAVFGKLKNAGNLDYVAGWYVKAAEYICNTNIHAAFVSTNSITQGEQPAILWQLLMKNGIRIDFAWRTFKWYSESKDMAAVHCVIVGFSSHVNEEDSANYKPTIYESDEIRIAANSINAYLIDAPNVFVESRSNPICDAPPIAMGNQPIDGGNYLFTEEEKAAFLKKEPAAARYFRLWYGSYEFINNKPRWCLWLGACSPHELRKMPRCMERVENVRNYRLGSKSEGTRKIADKPTRFHVENMPKTNFLVIPEVSSERRRYIPMGFMASDVLCSNLVRLVPDATLYHFGVLTSSIHMSWMRAVCGRLKSDYRYSIFIVYNNFPWPEASEVQKAKITQTAQGILDARALYPDCSLADLYDELTMPAELRKAHRLNDEAVMKAYGFKLKLTESQIVAELMKLYSELINVHEE